MAHTINATDLDIDLDAMADRRYCDPIHIIEGVQWSMVDAWLAFTGKQPCQVCGDRPLRRNEYCAGCDRSGLDGRVTFPGLDVDEAPDADYRAILEEERQNETLTRRVGRS